MAILIFGKKSFSKQKILLGVRNPFDSVEGVKASCEYDSLKCHSLNNRASKQTKQ